MPRTSRTDTRTDDRPAGQPNSIIADPAPRFYTASADSCLSWNKTLDQISHCMRDQVATASTNVATTKATERFCWKEY